MNVAVRYFASHRDITGHTTEQFELPAGATVAQLWDVVASRYPRLSPFRSSLLFAVNEEFCSPTDTLSEGDEVAFIPPVSGGAPEPFVVTSEPLDPLALRALVAGPDYGAIVLFEGIVRNNFGGRTTDHLEYEAFAPMAIKVLGQLAAQARERWQTGPIAIHHRIGRLEIGEAAVLIAVASPHRHAAFEASEWLMDRIKEVAPIWKKEHWADGASEWVGDEKQRKQA